MGNQPGRASDEKSIRYVDSGSCTLRRKVCGDVPLEAGIDDARKLIARELEISLSATKMQRVYFADGSGAPLPHACIMDLPRLRIPLEGCRPMELSRCHRREKIAPVPGELVFFSANAWTRPDWSIKARVLDILFGADHLTLSVLDHETKNGRNEELLTATVPNSANDTIQPLLHAMTAYGRDGGGPPLDRLLAESLLHSCIWLLKRSPGCHQRKAAHTYEAICSYVQEHYQAALTRETVATHFSLTPNHISRLFQQEGFMGFIDYLNMVRVSRAKLMLQELNVPLKVIATACGYRDTAYFCRVFKRIYKATPTDCRAREAPSHRGRVLALSRLRRPESLLLDDSGPFSNGY
jgi:AraC-like DNA-binding protein